MTSQLPDPHYDKAARLVWKSHFIGTAPVVISDVVRMLTDNFPASDIKEAIEDERRAIVAEDEQK